MERQKTKASVRMRECRELVGKRSEDVAFFICDHKELIQP